MEVDVLIIGGGIQGLLLLRELTGAGHRCLLVTNGYAGEGQTLHSHGLLNSGTGLVTGETHAELVEHVLPYLHRLGVPVYGDDLSYLGLPPAAVDQLRPVWAGHGYRPEPVSPSDRPDFLHSPHAFYRVPGYHVPKRALVAALAGGLERCIVRGEVVQAENNHYRLGVSAGGSTVEIRAVSTIVAAGCGSMRLLERILGPVPLAARVGYTKGHMITLRAAVGALPVIGTVATAELVVVGHLNRDHDTVGSDDYVTWYATPAVADPVWYDTAPDDATAEVEPALVGRGIALLEGLFPVLAEAAPGVEAAVFAGFKQNVDALMTRRLFATVHPERRIHLALPSVLAHAFANAREAVAILGDDGSPRSDGSAAAPLAMVDLPLADVGAVNELRAGTDWSSWGAFRATYRQ